MSAPLEWAPLLKGRKINKCPGAHSDNYGSGFSLAILYSSGNKDSFPDLVIQIVFQILQKFDPFLLLLIFRQGRMFFSSILLYYSYYT